MSGAQLNCDLNLGTETLTAWGDLQLDAAEAQRVAAHVPGCPACQSLLRDYAFLKQRLSAAQGPDLRGEIWRGMRAGIERPPRLALNQRAVWRGAAAVGAVIVVVALFAQVFQLGRHGRPPVSVAPTATNPATPTIMPTETTSALHLPGWQNTGPAYAGTIVFAPTAPLTGYTCGKVAGGPTAALLSANSAPRGSGPGTIPLIQGDIPFGVTQDGGKTWTTVNTGIIGTACWVTVDPTNAQDVVFAYDRDCLTTCEFGPINDLARSTDGGHSWQTMSVPADPQGAGKLLLSVPEWAGGTLLDLAVNMAAQQSMYILVSAHGAPFTTINEATVRSGMPANYTGGGVIAVGDAIYMTAFKDDGFGFGSYAAISADNGATWRYQPLSYHNIPVVLDDASLDGKILLGTFFSPDGPQPPGEPQRLPMLESRDGGATWTELPSPANGEFFMHGYDSGIAGIVQDGTIYAACHITSPDSYGIYALAPGASAWKLVAPGMLMMLQTVSTNANGKPVALWGHAGSNIQNFEDQIFGLQTFSLGS